jgi:hypothetical protein
LRSTEQIAKNVIEAISRGRSELYEFINFAKLFGIALKIAFRCDRQAAWELLGIYLRELEKIALWRRKYNERIDEVSRKIKESSSMEPLNERMKIILDEARKLNEEFEEDYRSMLEKRKERLEGELSKQQKSKTL